MSRTALITGGNRGIGLAVARALAGKGLRVVVAARRREEAAAAGIEGARALVLDLESGESIAAALTQLARDGVTIDVLVNNAGVYPHGAALDEGTPAGLRQALEVHLHGPLLLARGVLPGMLARGYGRIVNVSSGYGSFADGLGGSLPYSVSKAALNALTVHLARAADLHPDVKVNAACPGWVRTRMGGEGAERSPEEGAAGIVHLATLPPDGPNGGFFRDGRSIEW